jgi:arylsulfatase A-like enzyme
MTYFKVRLLDVDIKTTTKFLSLKLMHSSSRFFHSFSLVCTLALASLLTAAEKPNVIVIIADDLGYGDLSCYGATAFKTPNIDKLATEGRRFTSGYCSASTCTPTRVSLLTGSYAFRTKGTGIAPPNGKLTISPDTTTLPDLAKTAGYHTAAIGKWHLGLGGQTGPDWNGEIKPGPLEIGFDHAFLLPTTNDRVPQVYLEDHRVVGLDPKDPLWVGDKLPAKDHPTGVSHRDSLKMDWSHGHNGTIHNGISRIGFYTGGHTARFRDEDLADKWVEKSNAWIESHHDKPFFLYFASHDLHVPRMPHERFQGKSGLGFRGDSIIQLDWCVGELMKTLERLKIADNTLIIFCSDNGPVMDDGYKDQALEKLGSHRAAGPFSGGKYSVYEGGTRTPFITYWKGKIQPSVSDEVVCTIDIAASFAALTGTPLPENEFLDSFDVSDVMIGKDGAKGREHLIQQDNGGKANFGFRVGNWKLVRHDTKSARNVVVERPLAGTKVPQFQLFDLAKDPSEKTNVIEENPEVAEQMKERLEKYIADGRSRVK